MWQKCPNRASVGSMSAQQFKHASINRMSTECLKRASVENMYIQQPTIASVTCNTMSIKCLKHASMRIYVCVHKM